MAPSIAQSTDESIPAGARQIEAQLLNPGDQVYWPSYAGTGARTVKHVEPAPESGTVLVVYAGGSFEDLDPGEVVTVTAPAEPTPEQAEADRQAAGLRRLADMIQANPELAIQFRYPIHNMNVPISRNTDEKAALAATVRAASRAGAVIVKDTFGTGDVLVGARVTLGEVQFSVWGRREQVCERVVTGTREVTEEVPDAEALAAVPTVTVTKTVEDVEWVCRPLLADEQAPVCPVCGDPDHFIHPGSHADRPATSAVTE
jgi:hypothetical protein